MTQKHVNAVLHHLSENNVGGARGASDSPDAGVLKMLFKANLFSDEKQEIFYIFHSLVFRKISLFMRRRILKNVRATSQESAAGC